MDSSLAEFHKEIISYVDQPKVALACPRNFAKTTIIGFFYSLFCLCEQEHRQIVLIGPTAARAEETMAKIRTELEENQSIKEVYGELVGNKLWTNSGLELRNKTCIVARGYGQTLRGISRQGRPSLIICDDMEEDEQVLSEDRRKKFKDWFFRVVVPALSHPETSQVFIVGTLLHQEAFLTNMVNGEFPGYVHSVYQAIKHEGTSLECSLWPSRWDLKTLKDLQATNPIYFAQEYMNQPIADEQRIFREEWIRYYETKDLPKGASVYITCDPALLQKSSADYTAVIVVAVDKNKNIYVLESIQRRMLPKEIISTLFEKAIQYKAKAIGIEETAYQKSLLWDMQDEVKKQEKWLRVIPLKSENRRKELRIKSLQPKFSNGEIFFRDVGQEELIRQVKLYTSVGPGTKHDDLIDALAYQIQIIGPGREVKEEEKLPWNSYESLQKASKENKKRLRVLGHGLTKYQSWRRNSHINVLRNNDRRAS